MDNNDDFSPSKPWDGDNFCTDHVDKGYICSDVEEPVNLIDIGQCSYHGRSLHHISNTPNPYEQAISIIGQTLSKFDEDNLIPCFGFGDGNDSLSQLTAYRTIYNFSNSHFNSTLHSSTSTHDQDVFCFYPDERPCNGFSEALERYRELVPHLRLADKLLLPCPAM